MSCSLFFPSTLALLVVPSVLWFCTWSNDHIQKYIPSAYFSIPHGHWAIFLQRPLSRFCWSNIITRHPIFKSIVEIVCFKVAKNPANHFQLSFTFGHLTMLLCASMMKLLSLPLCWKEKRKKWLLSLKIMLWVIIFSQNSIVKKEMDVKFLIQCFVKIEFFSRWDWSYQIRKKHLGSQLERSIDIKYI